MLYTQIIYVILFFMSRTPYEKNWLTYVIYINVAVFCEQSRL